MSERIEARASTVAVIAARGGSKRVPAKNIREMMGKPVIAYTIEAAMKSQLFDQVIVSTDTKEIATIAIDCGACVPFLREASLSDDFTPVSVATVDALKRIDPDGDRYDNIAQLMANCPLRTAEDVRNSYEQFINSQTVAQLSVTRYGWQNPWWAMRRNQGFELQPIFGDRVTQRSQDLPELFCPTGAIWWAKTDSLRQEGTFHMERRTGWEIDWRHGMDIDTEDDWLMAELLMRQSQLITEAHA